MNKLTKVESQLTIHKDVSLVDIRMDPQRFPRLRQFRREVAIHQMSIIVTQAFMYRGQSAEENNIQFIASTLVDELLADTDNTGTSYLTFQEIQMVVKRAALTQDMYGISVHSLYKSLVEYTKKEGNDAREKAEKRKEAIGRVALERSGVTPMVTAYTGEFLRNNKL